MRETMTNGNVTVANAIDRPGRPSLARKSVEHADSRSLSTDRNDDVSVDSFAREDVFQRFATVVRQFPWPPENRLPRRIGVTAASRGEGVTTVSINLALCAQQLLDHEVLWVDANGMSPRIYDQLRVAASPGLCDVVREEANPPRAIQQSRFAKLSVVAAGRQRPRSAEAQLACLGTLTDALISITAEAHTVLVDLPPVSQIGDPCNHRGFWKALDAVLLVVAAEKTPSKEVHLAARGLRHADAPLIGIVYNQCFSRLPRWLLPTN